MKFNLHSLYKATEGEGIYLGTPQIFIRFQGCAVGCVNCDSLETWDFKTNQSFILPDLLRKVEELGGETIRRVSLTGGDPLHPKNLQGARALALALKEKDFLVKP